MLSVGKVGPANAGYYQSEVVAGLEDYYAGDGEAPGRWIGRTDLIGVVAGSVATAVDAGLLLEAKSAPDGTRFLIAHMQRQFRGLPGDFDVAVYGHTHKPRIHHDRQGRLFINPGETSGWTFGRPTVVILETDTMEPQLVDVEMTRNAKRPVIT